MIRINHVGKSILAITSFCVVLFETADVGAHGGGGSEPPKEKTKTIEARSTPKTPNALSYAELTKIMSQEKSPHDVAVVRCTLNSYASCRGLQIALYDKKGKQILVGNTGGDGIVGFEGLLEDHQYEARVETSKYKGSIILTPGGAWTLNADRAVD